uniref:Putative homing endonuclease n=1 Tax=viral metagenome TaxID=1070528 RepID=A0A6M3LIV4_9ZZZZ
MCQWCETAGHRVDPESLFYLDGHHIIRRSRGGGNDISNAYLCHRMCHTEITDKNVDVLKYPTKELWEAKDD